MKRSPPHRTWKLANYFVCLLFLLCRVYVCESTSNVWFPYALRSIKFEQNQLYIIEIVSIPHMAPLVCVFCLDNGKMRFISFDFVSIYAILGNQTLNTYESIHSMFLEFNNLFSGMNLLFLDYVWADFAWFYQFT